MCWGQTFTTGLLFSASPLSQCQQPQSCWLWSGRRHSLGEGADGCRGVEAEPLPTPCLAGSGKFTDTAQPGHGRSRLPGLPPSLVPTAICLPLSPPLLVSKGLYHVLCSSLCCRCSYRGKNASSLGWPRPLPTLYSMLLSHDPPVIPKVILPTATL